MLICCYGLSVEQSKVKQAISFRLSWKLRQSGPDPGSGRGDSSSWCGRFGLTLSLHLVIADDEVCLVSCSATFEFGASLVVLLKLLRSEVRVDVDMTTDLLVSRVAQLFD